MTSENISTHYETTDRASQRIITRIEIRHYRVTNSLEKIYKAAPSSGKPRGRSQITLKSFWTFLGTYPTHIENLSWNWINWIMENLHTVDISRTTYLPRLVNAVCEWPHSDCNNSRTGCFCDMMAEKALDIISNYWGLVSVDTHL